MSQALTVSAVDDAYSAKYGKPTTESGSWPTNSEVISHVIRKGDEQFKCVRVWHSDGQVITASLDMTCDQLFITVEYDTKKLPQI
jgi:hypothetical protein